MPHQDASRDTVRPPLRLFILSVAEPVDAGVQFVDPFGGTDPVVNCPVKFPELLIEITLGECIRLLFGEAGREGAEGNLAAGTVEVILGAESGPDRIPWASISSASVTAAR